MRVLDRRSTNAGLLTSSVSRMLASASANGQTDDAFNGVKLAGLHGEILPPVA